MRPRSRRPEEFLRGAAAGSISLVKNSAYGVFNFMSLLMGSVSKGLAVLSLDDDFVQRFSERPANTQEAFIQGAQVRGQEFGYFIDSPSVESSNGAEKTQRGLRLRLTKAPLILDAELKAPFEASRESRVS